MDVLAKVIVAARLDERCVLLKEMADKGQANLADYPEYLEHSADVFNSACDEFKATKFLYVSEVAAHVEMKPDKLLRLVSEKQEDIPEEKGDGAPEDQEDKDGDVGFTP